MRSEKPSLKSAEAVTILNDDGYAVATVVQVLGRDVPLSAIRVGVENGYLTLASPVPRGPNFKGDVFMANSPSAPEAYQWASTMNTEGLVSAVRFALKNCIE